MYQQRDKTPTQYNGPKKYQHFINSPFSLEHNGVSVKVDDKGKMIVTQDHKDSTFDEISSTVSMMNRILRMAEIHTPFTLEYYGVNIKVEKSGKVTLSQEQSDGTFDEIVTDQEIVEKTIRILHTTRKVVYRDEPYNGEVEGEN